LSNKKKNVNVMKYAGMATQLFAIMFVLLYLGQKLDAYFSNAKPYMTILFPTLGLFAYLYKLVKDLS